MFRLSKGAEYAIRGVLYLSLQPRGKVAYIDEVCKDQDVPKAYLAKIFQTLSKKGLLISTRGPVAVSRSRSHRARYRCSTS